MSDRFEHKRAFVVSDFKALGGKKGEFSAVVSVFGNVDRGGDRVAPTAFTKTLERWGESGDPIPMIWNHMWDNPDAHIGEADANDVKASERHGGLLVERGVVDVDKPFAGQVFHLLERRRVKEFSFGYNLLDAERKNGALDLLELDLIEFGPTLKGMNPATELLAVKALAAVADVDPAELGTLLKAPRTVGGALRQLRRQVSDINELLASIDFESIDETPDTDDAKADHGTASDPDQDVTTAIELLRGQLP